VIVDCAYYRDGERQHEGRMSTAEAAEYMRVSIRWLRQHLHQIPHSKVEGRLFFSSKELDAWLAENRRS